MRAALGRFVAWSGGIGVSCVIAPISTRSLEDFQELVATSPARGFLHKSALSAHAVGVVLGNTGTCTAT
ncbi:MULTISPECIES: hypothetical protein [unclassified Streptomyces]|uniref:hypothetical protein n=1 Tax=unclassified Streptomyces TaxID=2593676 RepID=UPI00236585A6|nr:MULTISPECIES: hypothetical protein [unclassified Streptomyces]MDF3144779.1 hypothetical protein [Streptomyces sp. T21Q-yed]WDF37268.1 hypothetical protein PBV52_10960 [Streptomyces sp. T12]